MLFQTEVLGNESNTGCEVFLRVKRRGFSNLAVVPERKFAGYLFGSNTRHSNDFRTISRAS